MDCTGRNGACIDVWTAERFRRRHVDPHAAESGGRGHASDGAEADGRGYLEHQPQLEGCSGTFQWGMHAEMVSAEGLLLTNHHCGYGQVQQHSTVDNDLLTDFGR